VPRRCEQRQRERRDRRRGIMGGRRRLDAHDRLSAGMVRALSGVVGVIRWGYYNAVAVEGYTITRTGGTYTLVARVVPRLLNELNLSIRPPLFATPSLL